MVHTGRYYHYRRQIRLESDESEKYAKYEKLGQSQPDATTECSMTPQPSSTRF